MTENFVLLPAPRYITWLEGNFTFTDGRLVLLDSRQPQAVRFAALRFCAVARQYLGLDWELTASSAVPAGQVGLTLAIMPEAVAHPEGYRLRVAPEGITIQGRDAAGVFYGVCTLIQLAQQAEGACCRVWTSPTGPISPRAA